MASIGIIKSIDWNNRRPRPILACIPQGTAHITLTRRSFSHMSGIGQRFPQFSLTGVVSNDIEKAFQPFTQDSFPGKWRVVFFWPKDFTFVCPTEIAAFGKLDK